MIIVRIIAVFPMTGLRSNIAKYFLIFSDRLQLDIKVGSEKVFVLWMTLQKVFISDFATIF